MACVAAHAQTPADLPDIVVPQQPLSLALGPAQTRLVHVTVPPGGALLLSVQQTLGAVSVARLWAPKEPTRSNAAGLQSTIVLHLAGAAEAGENLAIRNLSADKPASAQVLAGPAHPATRDDQLRAQAELKLAAAEELRSRRDPASYPEALADYDAAISLGRETGDHQELARALSWKALFLFVNQSDAAAALPLTAEATADLSGLDAVEAANCLKIAGYVNVQLAQYDAGRTDYLAAIERFEATGDLFNQEVLLDNLSRLERMQGNSDAALSDAERAGALADRLADLKRKAKIESSIGAIHLTASRLEPAYAAYQRALALLKQTPDPLTEGYVWSDLGVLYTLLHQFREAGEALDQASAIWSRTPNPPGELNTLDDLGELAIQEGKIPLARTYLRRGLVLATAQGLPRPRIYLLRGLGATDLRDHRLAEARDELNQALQLALATKEGDGLPEIYCLLGDAEALGHNSARARDFYEQCGRTAAATDDAYSTIRAQGSLARLELEAGDADAAAVLIEQALAGIESVRKAIPEQDLRTSFFSSMRSYYDLEISALDILDRRHPGNGYAWRALLTAERARARMLLDWSQETGPRAAGSGSGSVPAELVAAEASLRAEQRLLDKAPRGSARAAELGASVAQLTVRRDALTAETSTSSTEGAPAVITLESLQSMLGGKRSVLLEYWLGKQTSLLWAVTSAGLRCFRLSPAAAIEAQSHALLRDILATVSNDPTLTAEQRVTALPLAERHSAQAAASLRRTILPPGALPDRAEQTLVVPDGALLGVPFAIVLRGAELLTEPSATFLMRLMNAAAANPPASQGTSPRQPRIAIFIAGGGQPGEKYAALPFVSAEASAIRTAFGPAQANVFEGDAATPQAIRNFPFDDYTIAHFASHATLNRENMQLTGMVLNRPAKAGDGGGDKAASQSSMLWYSDVRRLHARLDLVVLSECESGAGQSVPGEGLVGLSHAFFLAGAQRVLATLWPVDDEAASALMRSFYRSLQTGASPAAALRVAQRQMSASAEWHSPYYWAGFTLAGDWRGLQ